MRLGQAITALAAVAAVTAAGCGAGSKATGGQHTKAASGVSAHHDPARAPGPPPVVTLRLELPLVGLSSAQTVSYATSAPAPTVRGVVQPAAATVYMQGPGGARTAVNPRRDGSFTIPAKLDPGPNTFRFIAARLGARSASARLAITWRGRAAAARRRAIASDPAKYLAPASAGINRKLAPVGKVPAVTAPSHKVTVTYSLNTIKAPAPPATGGDGRWLSGFELTEYYPALESWFVGRAVSTPGLGSPHRIDWLYSARGVSMEGDGIGLDGKPYHIENLGSGGWLTAGGGAGAKFGVGSDAPFWRTGGFWRSSSGALTFPLARGGWSSGNGVKYVSPPAGVSFAAGPSRPLSYLRSVAVDPSLIPFGSHIFIPAYQDINGGWFEADDTGGAIIGRHIDVFRPPPSNPNAGDSNGFLTGQQVYIVGPGRPIP
ncbi:MAG TPA: 3D domain-containing protein [Solirubrobacteraceae bacterium]